MIKQNTAKGVERSCLLSNLRRMKKMRMLLSWSMRAYR